MRCVRCKTSKAPQEHHLPGGALGFRPRFYVCNDCDWAYHMPTGDRVLDDVVALYIDRHNRTGTNA